MQGLRNVATSQKDLPLFLLQLVDDEACGRREVTTARSSGEGEQSVGTRCATANKNCVRYGRDEDEDERRHPDLSHARGNEKIPAWLN